jgi:Domain of unknown function (DUF6268)
MIRFKFFLLMFCFYKSHSQNQNFLSYKRVYYDNDHVLSTTTDEFNLKFQMRNNFSFFSNFTNSHINLLHPLNNYNDEEISTIYGLDIGLKKEFLIVGNWKAKVILNPQIINSNFSNLAHDNFIFNTSVSIQKYFRKNTSFTLSVEYGTQFGKPRVYPLIAFTKKISPKMSYLIGFPKSSFTYDFNEKNSFEFIGINESYYSPINNSYSRYLEQTALSYKSLFISKITASLGYNYYFSNRSIININLGKSFHNNLTIEESNYTSTKYNFSNNFTISMGFKYNLNFK